MTSWKVTRKLLIDCFDADSDFKERKTGKNNSLTRVEEVVRW